MSYQLHCPACGTVIGYGNFADGPNGDVIHSTSISGIRVHASEITVPEPQSVSVPQTVAPFPTTPQSEAAPAPVTDQVETPQDTPEQTITTYPLRPEGG